MPKIQNCRIYNIVLFVCIAFYHVKLYSMTHYCTVTHLIDILKIEPGIEGSDGQVQVWQLEICDPSADVSLVSIDTKSGKTQAELLQHGQVHGDGVVLIKIHGECIRLDLWETENSLNVGIFYL